MLTMVCSHCEGVIKSPFLAEIKSTTCSHCSEDVEVQDVYVSTKGFNLSRKDLLNRISHYKKLLAEVEEELKSTEADGTEKTNSQKSTNSFHSILKDLMQGARDNYRLEIPYSLYIEMDCDGHKRLGKLVNICAQGASIEFSERDKVPQPNSEIQLILLLPESKEALSLPAKIVWAKKPRKVTQCQNVNVGVQYRGLDEKTRVSIWNFIVENTSVPSLQ